MLKIYEFITKMFRVSKPSIVIHKFFYSVTLIYNQFLIKIIHLSKILKVAYFSKLQGNNGYQGLLSNSLLLSQALVFTKVENLEESQINFQEILHVSSIAIICYSILYWLILKNGKTLKIKLQYAFWTFLFVFGVEVISFAFQHDRFSVCVYLMIEDYIDYLFTSGSLEKGSIKIWDILPFFAGTAVGEKSPCIYILVRDFFKNFRNSSETPMTDEVEKVLQPMLNPATSAMEGILDFHFEVMFFLIVIAVLVCYFLFRIVNFYSIEDPIVVYLESNHFYKNQLNYVFLMLYSGSLISIAPRLIQYKLLDSMFTSTFYLEDFDYNIHGIDTAKVPQDQLLETIWTVVPTLILFFIAIPSFALLYAINELILPEITVKADGNQWFWTYEISYKSFINRIEAVLQNYKPLDLPWTDLTDFSSIVSEHLYALKDSTTESLITEAKADGLFRRLTSKPLCEVFTDYVNNPTEARIKCAEVYHEICQKRCQSVPNLTPSQLQVCYSYCSHGCFEQCTIKPFMAQYHVSRAAVEACIGIEVSK